MVACFIGHRTITVTDELCERIRTTVLDLIDNQDVDTLLFGSRSQFDELCLNIVTEIKEIRPHIRRFMFAPNTLTSAPTTKNIYLPSTTKPI